MIKTDVQIPNLIKKVTVERDSINPWAGSVCEKLGLEKQDTNVVHAAKEYSVTLAVFGSLKPVLDLHQTGTTLTVNWNAARSPPHPRKAKGRHHTPQ